MHDLRTHPARHVHIEAGHQEPPQKLVAIFATLLERLHQSRGTATLPPRRAPQPQTRPRPQLEPGRRCLRLVGPPQITTARWAALSRSQIQAARLIRVGALEGALQALREGTWRNPEEELRKLLISFQRHGNSSQSTSKGKEAA